MRKENITLIQNELENNNIDYTVIFNISKGKQEGHRGFIISTSVLDDFKKAVKRVFKDTARPRLFTRHLNEDSIQVS